MENLRREIEYKKTELLILENKSEQQKIEALPTNSRLARYLKLRLYGLPSWEDIGIKKWELISIELLKLTSDMELIASILDLLIIAKGV